MTLDFMTGARGGRCAGEVSVEELTMEPGLEGGGLLQVRRGEEAESRAKAEMGAQALPGGWR